MPAIGEMGHGDIESTTVSYESICNDGGIGAHVKDDCRCGRHSG
jgi:hypothetical protein